MQADNKPGKEYVPFTCLDIRTPMNTIIGFTTLAVSNIDDRKGPDYPDKILSTSNHLLSLINDILEAP